jgi:2-methylcitrate dehydratase PrpD
LELRWGELAGEVQDRTRELVMDLLGVALGGTRQASSAPAARAAVHLGGAGAAEGQASVFGTQHSTSAVWAALANGTAAHALELDDVTTESSLHPGVAVIPGAFALAEALGASPAPFLEAVVAGYEVTMRVGNALNPASAYARGFHPTGVAGVFGATMAAGRLLELDEAQLTQALGIAGTLASGSLEYLSNGAWTKRLNPGWAGHAGITAAYLAREGFSGPATALEGRLGLLHAYSDEPRPHRLLEKLGDPLQVMRVSIKPYACCRYNHGLIDCVLQLRQEHGVRPEDVDSIRLGVLTGGAVLVAKPIEQKRQPHSIVDAQFSAPFAAAAALVLGTGGLDAYTQANLDDARIQTLMARTDCYTDPSLDAPYPEVWPAEAELVLTNGQSVKKRIEYALGEPENPVPRGDLVGKFCSLAGGVVREPAALAERILHIDGERDLRGLGMALRG